MKHTPYRNRGKTAGDFRLIRLFSVAHNIARLTKHCERLRQQDRGNVNMRRVRLKARRIARAQA